eukprot:3486236-Pyramimonas_sp.AAC.1
MLGDMDVVSCRAFTFLLHMEVINLLIVMSSTQLTSSAGTAGPEAHPFLAAMIYESSLAPGL